MKMKKSAVLVSSAAATALFSVVAFGQSPLQSQSGDLARAKNIEIRDSSGAVVLAGAFDHRPERDGDIDKDARLQGSGGARGEADIDIDISEQQQELEVEVRGLTVSQNYSVWIDGAQIGTFKTNALGRADREWKGRRHTKTKP